MTSPERRFNPEWIKNQPETGIRDADPELLARRTVQSRVQVYKINPGSRAEAVGLKKGDIIRSSNGNNIDFKTRWNGEDIEHPVTLSVENTEGEVREIIVQRPFGCVLVEAPIEDRDLGNNERMVSLCLDSFYFH